MHVLFICTSGIKISSNCVELIFVKVHLSTFRASRDAVFYNSFVCQTFRPWGSSSVTGGGLQGFFIYRHLFPPFSITSSVMSSVTSFPEEGEVKGVFIKRVSNHFLVQILDLSSFLPDIVGSSGLP